MNGIEFPINYSKKTANLTTNTSIDNIKQSIRLIILTEKGERFFDGNFGCSMNRFMFEPINEEVILDIGKEIEQSVIENESRVRDLRVEVEQGSQDGELKIHVCFKVDSHREENMELELMLNP
jgi:phage baseplate assembly protein W